MDFALIMQAGELDAEWAMIGEKTLVGREAVIKCQGRLAVFKGGLIPKDIVDLPRLAERVERFPERLWLGGVQGDPPLGPDLREVWSQLESQPRLAVDRGDCLTERGLGEIKPNQSRLDEQIDLDPPQEGRGANPDLRVGA